MHYPNRVSALTGLLVTLTLHAAALTATAQNLPPATQKASLFDPAIHMRVADVRPGMKGYGLTVFQGTKIERFEVEVIDVVNNFGPGFDAVLIMAKGDYLQHTGGIAGMSGSPIYLTGEDGKSRLIGAFAFGWNMAKDPIAGVQPIEYMLEYADPKLPRDSVAGGPEVKVEGTGGGARRARWNYFDLAPLPGRPAPAAYPLASRDQWVVNPSFTQLNGHSEKSRSTLTGLSFSATGLGEDLISSWKPLFSAYGLRSLQAGVGGGTARPVDPNSPPEIVPGASLVVPVMTGDVELAAFGTCTEVIGDRVYGFGHPFNSEGGVELPMAAGHVNTVVASLTSSFKLGVMTKELGVLRTDTSVGVGGTFGGAAKTIPVSVHVIYEDGSVNRTLNFRIARHPRFTPLLSVLTAQSALGSLHELPNQFTVDFNTEMKFEGEKAPLTIANRLANANPAEMLFAMATPVMAATENPFGRSYPESITTTLRVTAGARAAEIIGARADRSQYRPGDTVRIFATSRLLRGPTEETALQLQLPKNIDPGEYTIVVSDASRYQSDDAEQRPNLYYADSLPDIFKVLRLAAKLRSDRWYVRLNRETPGIAIGRMALRRLPASREKLLSETSGISGLGRVTDPLTTNQDAGRVLTGSSEVTITVIAEPGRKPRPSAADPSIGGNRASSLGSSGSKLNLQLPDE